MYQYLSTLKFREMSIGLFVIVFAMIFSVSLTFAETPELPGSIPALPLGPAPAGTVSCFDYYRFGSVKANITARTSSAVSGTPVTFTGTVFNDNPYPIVDGSLYVKVFRLRDDPVAHNVNGPFVVDQLVVREGIDLKAGGSLPVVFSWDIPSFTLSGEYQIATFFTTSKKFNLLGLSFTDDVVGNTARFSVVGEQTKSIELNKDSVTVNGKPYLFGSFPPHVPVGPAELAMRVQNDTDTDMRVPVRWQVYSWDALRRENFIEQKTQEVFVKARSSAPITYVVSDARFPVYYIVTTLGWQNTQSVLNIRFIREGTDRTRINFPGVTEFPLQKGNETTLFSCLHNSGQADVVPNGRLELRLSDLSGNTIHEYVYKGDVTGAMMGVAEKFIPKKGYDAFNLDAMLYQNDVLVDEAHLNYDCEKIDPSACLPESETQSALEALLLRFPLPLIAAASGLLIALVAAVYMITRWRRHKRDNIKI